MLFPGQNVRRTNKLLSPNRATNTDNAKQTRSLCLSLSLPNLLTETGNNICAQTARFNFCSRDPKKQRANSTRGKKRNQFRSVCRARCEIARAILSPSLSLSLEPASGGTRTCLEQSEQNERRYEGNRLCVRYALLLHAVPQDPRALSSSAEPGRGDKSSRE